MVLIYEALNDAERQGVDSVRLQDEVLEALLRFLERCGMSQTSCQ
jgi:hypothetical protein